MFVLVLVCTGLHVVHPTVQIHPKRVNCLESLHIKSEEHNLSSFPVRITESKTAILNIYANLVLSSDKW